MGKLLHLSVDNVEVKVVLRLGQLFKCGEVGVGVKLIGVDEL